MIKLDKGPKPAILEANETQWTNDYIVTRASGISNATVESRHRHPEIKSAIIQESCDKCIYCEEKITSSQFGDVEHILPKSIFPELYATWCNLALACVKCNNAKLDKTEVVNPFVQNPSDYIFFGGPMLLYDNASPLGFGTVRGLKLNRIELLSRRTSAIEALVDKLDRWHFEIGARRVILQDEIFEAIKSDKEFAGTLRALLLLMKFQPNQL